MKSERIYSAIGASDDELLTRCESAEKHPKSINRRKLSALAVCLCLIIISAVVINILYRTDQDSPADGMVISSYKDADGFPTSGSYVAPKDGTWSFTVEVKDALKEYSGMKCAGQEVIYFLQMDILSEENTHLTSDSTEIKAELKRLISLGYNVGYAQAWTYRGQGEQVYYDYVAGYFTADELDNFQASKDYGYHFSFATNGDGTPVDAERGIITDFYNAESGFDVN